MQQLQLVLEIGGDRIDPGNIAGMAEHADLERGQVLDDPVDKQVVAALGGAAPDQLGHQALGHDVKTERLDIILRWFVRPAERGNLAILIHGQAGALPVVRAVPADHRHVRPHRKVVVERLVQRQVADGLAAANHHEVL